MVYVVKSAENPRIRPWNEHHPTCFVSRPIRALQWRSSPSICFSICFHWRFFLRRFSCSYGNRRRKDNEKHPRNKEDLQQEFYLKKVPEQQIKWLNLSELFVSLSPVLVWGCRGRGVCQHRPRVPRLPSPGITITHSAGGESLLTNVYSECSHKPKYNCKGRQTYKHTIKFNCYQTFMHMN